MAALEDTVPQQSVGHSYLKSPTAPLPRFSGKDSENFTKFIFAFEEITKKFNYSNYDLFILLKQQLSDNALILINSFKISNQNYDKTESLLKEAFACPVTEKYKIIKQLSEIKLDFNDEPLVYISQIKSIADQISTLNISVEKFFLEYFFWTRLNESFQNIVIQITNKCKPNFKELNDCFFSSTERYNRLKKSKPSKANNIESNKNKCSSNFAVAINKENPKTFNCNHCSKDNKSADHLMSKCTVYKDPNSKVNKLKEHCACLKCGYTKHTTNKCRYKFRRACNFGKYHYSFLCKNDQSKPDNVN